MIQIGKMNRLLIKGKEDAAIILDGAKYGDIVLRGGSGVGRYSPGDTLTVFVYVNKEQQVVATTNQPYVLVGEFEKMNVVGTSEAGAFLGWGLEDDLFVPKSEQQNSMKQGQSYVVYTFLSPKTNRIAASSKLNKFLDQAVPKYNIGEEVELLVYAETEMGYSVVVNGSHSGLIYQNEVFQVLELGQRLKGYVKKIREDQKIDIRLQQAGFHQVDGISQDILKIIKKSGGKVDVTDKSKPEVIYSMFGVSKKNFKKAIGTLYKKRYIVIGANSIKLAE